MFSKIFTHLISLLRPNMPFYAVKRGRKPGVYTTWPECQELVKGYFGSRYKKFNTEDEAWDFVRDEGSPDKFQSSQGISAGSAKKSVQTAVGDVKHASPTCPNTSSVTSPARVSSTRLLALKGTIAKMKGLSEQLRQYVTQAEEQMEQIEMAKKRPAADMDPEPERASTSTKIIRSLQYTPAKGHRNTSDDKPAIVYTDGCCLCNGKSTPRGGIGVYWGPDHPLNLSEKLLGRQTNNRAEILAACRAIEQAKDMAYKRLVIHTDSQFCINGITKWIHKWKQNGWKLSTGKNVINKEDFMQLDAQLDGTIDVTWVHVAGHCGIPGNEEADRLANEGASK